MCKIRYEKGFFKTPTSFEKYRAGNPKVLGVSAHWEHLVPG